MGIPIHRWFRFKEGFSANLLEWIYGYLPTIPTGSSGTIRILDPFCGSGTIALAAQQFYPNEIEVDSIEINPFLCLLAQSKVEAHIHEAEELENLRRKVFQWVRGNKHKQPNIPLLTTFQNTNYFSEKVCTELFLFRDAVERVCMKDSHKRFFQAAWAAILHQVSHLRKDGRALRYMPEREIQNVADAFRQQLSTMISDIQCAVQPRKKSRIFSGSAMRLSEVADCSNNALRDLNDCRYGLCLYSPPYCNCMDYSEVYKLELWGLRFIQSNDEFRNLRLSTLCSHPSIKRQKETYEISFDERCQNTWRIIQKLIKDTMLELSEVERKNHLPWMIKGYFNDMYIAIQQQIQTLLPGGYIVIVVSGSKHDPLVLSTDTLLASLLKDLGMTLVEILVGRTYWSRLGEIDNLRESIIIARKSITA